MACFDDTLGCEPVLDALARHLDPKDLCSLSSASRYLRWALTLSELGERHWQRHWLALCTPRPGAEPAPPARALAGDWPFSHFALFSRKRNRAALKQQPL